MLYSQQNDIIEIIGYIKKTPNKKKKNIESKEKSDYIFVNDSEEYFIHIYKSQIDLKTLDKLLGKKILINGFIEYGDLDNKTSESINPDQSRLGEYLKIITYKPL